MSMLYIKAYGIYVCVRVCICIRIYVLTKTNLVLPRDTINVTTYGPHEQKKISFYAPSTSRNACLYAIIYDE